MRISVIVGAFFMMLFTGCSWIEYFTISNPTNKEITITYELDNEQQGFYIFNSQPRVYALKKSKSINWDKKLEVVDKDTSHYTISIKLPSKSIVIIGELHNDKYYKYNQKFINDRVFNLKKISVSNKSNLIIVPKTFDSYFVKDDGLIDYQIK